MSEATAQKKESETKRVRALVARAQEGDRDSSFSFEADDGRYTFVLKRVVYVKRFARESRVGFGAVA